MPLQKRFDGILDGDEKLAAVREDLEAEVVVTEASQPRLTVVSVEYRLEAGAQFVFCHSKVAEDVIAKMRIPSYWVKPS